MNALIGIDSSRAFTAAEIAAGQGFRLGSTSVVQTANGDKEFVFCQANGAVTGAGYVCQFNNDFDAVMATTTTSAPGTGAGEKVGIAQAALEDNGGGWFQVGGYCAGIRVAASAVAATILNTTATGGQIDDDATAGSEVIEGLTLSATNGGSAGNVAGLLTYPTVGRTL